MIDIDNFKQLNDNLGHVAGDNWLMEFADILKKYSSPTAIPFRYGGDEFSILFKNSALNEVIQICEQIQEDFRKNNTKTEIKKLPSRIPSSSTLTLSPSQDINSSEINRADIEANAVMTDNL